MPDSPLTGIPDVGDLVDDAADDPTPDEVTDPAHPDYVEPWAPATPALAPEVRG